MEWKSIRLLASGLASLSVLILACGRTAPAQEWARKMFDHFSHDFGVLVRGQKAEHRFTFRNLYVEDVEVESVTSTCGCTVVDITKRLLKTHETSEIIARANTVQFLGRKEATVRVRFRKPFPAEVQLHCYMYIRSDVVFEPGQISFGTVIAGKESPAVSVTATHLARSDWQILELRAPSYMHATFKELSRQVGRTSYQIVARLRPETPPGYIRDNIMLVTNDPDPRLRTLTVQVEGIVSPPLSVRPSPLLLGVLTPGQKVLRKLVIQAQESFRLTGVELPSEAFIAALPEEANRLQVVVIEFTAPNTPGKITGVIRLKTDLATDGVVEVPVTGHIVTGEEKPADTSTEKPNSAPAASSPPGTSTVTDQS
ncbi:MAG: DUF1573 domain-containing protein [Thermoguttaceae bacterium]|nr:DUF1573 domain-containing protein [Thermoguttaceae bacterium]MDW8080079.1 DUF1573 domain-containing protein [Thermoguttaceae bacterium]